MTTRSVARRLLAILALAFLALWTACGSSAPAARAAGDAQAGMAADAPALNSLSNAVLVIYHRDVPESKDVAEHYARARGIPLHRLCGVAFPAEDILRGDHYLEMVKPAVRACLERAGDRDILYLVLSYRTPFKVMIPGQRFDAALDSLLADLWDDALPDPLPRQPSLPHPYFAAHDSAGNRFVPFTPLELFRDEPEGPRIYAVFRLDGASPDAAKGLVDRAIASERQGGPQGKGCFDRNNAGLQQRADSGYAVAEWDIQRAAEFASIAGYSIELDTNPQEFGEAPAPARCDAAALYAGWYSLDNYNDAFTWSPGAIGFHIDSMSAWNPRQGKNWVANALQRGITLTAGAVSEPFLPNFPQVDGVFHDLFHGATAGDALLRNTRLLKFRIIHVGDPLYRPFPNRKGLWASSPVLTPSVRVRSPRTLGGVPAVLVFRAEGDTATTRTLRLSVHPPELGSVDPELRFEPGVPEKELRVATKGVEKSTTLRVLAEGPSRFATGSVELLPVLVRLEAESSMVTGGSPAAFRLQVGAAVQSGSAPFDLKVSCAPFVQAPARVLVPAGQDSLRFELETRAVTKDTPCEITVSKFGASLRSTIVLSPTP